MDEQFSALMRTVQEEIALYRELIAHARKKTALLVRGPLEAILESNKADDTFNVRLRLLENELARLCQQIGQALHLRREEFTLLRLAEAAEQSVAAEIQSQSVLFRHLVEELKRVNQRNRKLVESSLRYSRGLLNLISNATSSYQSDGLFRPYGAAHSTISSKA